MQYIVEQVSQTHAGFSQLKLDRRIGQSLSLLPQISKAPAYQLFINQK
jgi:hypothetical protein